MQKNNGLYHRDEKDTSGTIKNFTDTDTSKVSSTPQVIS